MQRAINFGAGPSAIPLEVLKEAQEQFLDFNGSGLSIMAQNFMKMCIIMLLL